MSLASREVVVLPDIPIDFSAETILSTPPFPRWETSAASGSDLEATVRRLRDPVESALDIRGMYRTIPIEESGIEAFDAPADLLEADLVVPGVLTIGDGLHQTGGTDGLLDNLIADAMENVALQLARVEMLSQIREEAAAADLHTTRAFPPGVRGDDWDMENRRFMFEALPTERIDVHLRDGRVTEPRKTFAFAMGLGTDIEQADLLLSCADCEYTDDCPYVGSIVE